MFSLGNVSGKLFGNFYGYVDYFCPQIFAHRLCLTVDTNRGGNSLAQNAMNIKVQGMQVWQLKTLNLEFRRVG